MKSFYFSNCMAAFEGGGVKGAAYAGAYEAAAAAGIRFSKVGGSSAGSVVAALIAAGATAPSIRQRMLDTDFLALVAPPRTQDAPFKKSGVLKLVSALSFMNCRFLNVIVAGGLHSTSALYDWVEKNLREVLLEQGRSVPDRHIHFKDLVLPLYIVATDVAQKRPKVWSCDATPDEPVALAVQSSCAIPVFFQPVTSGASVLVDGGAISNLPTHVFSKSKGHPGRFAEKDACLPAETQRGTALEPFRRRKGLRSWRREYAGYVCHPYTAVAAGWRLPCRDRDRRLCGDRFRADDTPRFGRCCSTMVSRRCINL